LQTAFGEAGEASSFGTGSGKDAVLLIRAPTYLFTRHGGDRGVEESKAQPYRYATKERAAPRGSRESTERRPP
jgi:hypothetical protein